MSVSARRGSDAAERLTREFNVLKLFKSLIFLVDIGGMVLLLVLV